MSPKTLSSNARLAAVTLIFLGIASAGIAATATSSTEGGFVPAGSMGAGETATPTNVTVVQKNREFPLKLRMTMQPCAISACVDV